MEEVRARSHLILIMSSSILKFVYLRDNLLSSLEGIEILKRVKVLDLSFNGFKGPNHLKRVKPCRSIYSVITYQRRHASSCSSTRLDAWAASSQLISILHDTCTPGKKALYNVCLLRSQNN
ncbi:hypothetical protein L2E82_16450 [Cichorium intybus]|uniref:Uncharacterized protein n=1 Tax=Cichorium intybus TaxID=13427 RepID=A0ACB9F667_CICIN|nr:hypothetical protein L2E82_16450 [Cichorium intybus]